MFQHIKENAEKKDIWLDCVNGYQDHAHCLISLGREQTISKVAQLIKGESSFWMNQTGFIEKKFVWQDDFWAVGISETPIASTRKYILNQEKRHRKTTFGEELNEFTGKFGWSLIEQ